MGQDIPKQFINVFDKPVLIYTLESFQRHPDVRRHRGGVHRRLADHELERLCQTFNIDKLRGSCGGSSVRIHPATAWNIWSSGHRSGDIVSSMTASTAIDADVLTDVIHVWRTVWQCRNLASIQRADLRD